jgi:hypothetical protein
MSILNEIKAMGYTARIHPKKNRLGITPWESCPKETRQWFSDHRTEIESVLRGHSTVGSQLKKLIERTVPAVLRDKVPKSTCGCSDIEKKMNMWGIEKCKKETEYIISHLVGQSDKMGKAATTIPLVLRRKAAEKMLKLAIKMEQKAKLTE